MKDSFTVALIGLGNRGKDAYLPEFLKYGDKVRVTAIAEPVDEKRNEVAKLLDEGLIYNDILEKTGASSATISRVNRSLNYGTDAYREIFARVKESKT